MPLVAAGLLNRQVAAELATTERTIKFRRAHIMQKMQAVSVADLVRRDRAADARLQSPESRCHCAIVLKS